MGVFNIKGHPQMFVVQCVHMIKDMNFAGVWPEGQKRENRIIFIGRGMQQRRQDLTDCVMECVVKPLRFPVGAAVLARMGRGWDDRSKGTVIKHWDQLRAYRIKLEDGREVHAPMDEDTFVSAA